MSNAIPYLIQGRNIILVVDGKSHTISKDTHIAYGKIVEALKEQDWEALRNLVSPAKAIIDFGNGYVSIVGGEVFWKGQPFHNALTVRMIEMYQDGFPIDPMVRFMENLMENPSKRSVDQVYGFLEKNSLPITEDGHFLAFKRVREDYMDIHSGTIDNSIGEIVEMERNLVDDNPESHCSTGLHFCSESYLGSFGGPAQPVMILKINPADVVSIPTDYNGAKGRCMRYEVVGQVTGDASQAFVSAVNSDYNVEFEPASWPFATGTLHEDTDESLEDEFVDDDFSFDDDFISDDFSFDNEDLYDLVRVHGDWVEFSGLTLDSAREKRNKNIVQKKAQLKIVRTGETGPEID